MRPHTLAPYVLQILATYQQAGRLCTLADLVDEIQVRRSDLRRTVTALHHEGYVDALRMRLTMSGFVLGRALLKVQLPALRTVSAPAVAAA